MMIFFKHNQHALTKKEKKKALQKKNQMHMGLFNFVRMRRAEADRVRGLKEKAELEKKKSRSLEEEKRADKKEIWSVKVSTIRNRLNDKKRTSDERWNRFSTSDESSGGRGR